ncbi:protoporphyrinogen oxidase [Sinomonas cyclohexanicum]|uniref:Protoporphyrinogen oxidase n=1 Tax=Sinomonas cyclohexanicum TaxID=322009 RepID=A0ABM7PSS8_SINCY|nr:flavodoxin domain-containing protein [Corynebacterium cyclohexanicum]BCT75210.1 protoporphyrinogen oxidase [Corynebacterium cyclohexanicum]
MTQVFIAYGTTEGHTATISEFVADVLRGRGHGVTVADVNEMDAVPDEYGAIIVGDSVHVGKHDKSVIDFAARNLGALGSHPSAFLSVSLGVVGDEQEARKYVREFEAASGWHPEHVSLVAGALLYTQYSFVKRQLMRTIAASKAGVLSTDTSVDHIYTDWDQLRRFAEDFADQLASTPARPNPA